MDQLRSLALEPLRRQPAAFADIVSGEIHARDGFGGYQIPPLLMMKMCHSGVSVVIALQCAPRKRLNAAPNPGEIASQEKHLFAQIVLDGHILDIAMCYRDGRDVR